jgi:exodeoxyribonuclease V alpha subunit
MTPTMLLTTLDQLVDQGTLRALAATLARFLAEQGERDPAVLLAAALLSEMEGRGHACLPLERLADHPAEALAGDHAAWLQLAAAAPSAADWPQRLAAAHSVWQPDQLDLRGAPLVLDRGRLYLRRYWQFETRVAGAITARLNAAGTPDPVRLRTMLATIFGPADDGAAFDWQRAACALAPVGRLSVITGGPGTGKTYTVARLLALLFALSPDPAAMRVALAAPTGKAAARLKQAIDGALGSLAARLGPELPLTDLAARIGSARTLHRLLGARPDTRKFRHHAGEPLPLDVLIVDEASMIHLEMMAALLDALPEHATLVLLGDKDQLASVEAGAVMADLCTEAEAGAYRPETAGWLAATTGQTLPPVFHGAGGPLAQRTVMLRESHRFDGPIGVLAAAVNAGDGAAAEAALRASSGGVLDWLAPARLEAVIQLACGQPDAGYRPCFARLAQGPGEDWQAWARELLAAFDRFRLLAAVREGDWGVAGLNARIAAALAAQGLIRPRGEWFAGRPVMVTRNDPALGVFNGDIGLTLPAPRDPTRLCVVFADGECLRTVLTSRLRDVETAWAMTVHKSQGSEFSHTVLVLPDRANPVLTRELVYTGITRARERFTLATPNPMLFGVALATRTQRASGLAERLAG